MVHKKGLEHQQMVLEKVADVAIDLSVATASLSRASEAVASGSSTAEAEAALAALVVAEACVRMEGSLRHMQAHAKGAYGSTVRAPAADFVALEQLRDRVAKDVFAKGGWTATHSVGV